jgi:hypothetical protein
MPPVPERDDELGSVLNAAVRLQELVPDAVLVGGTAAALYAGHRVSLDDDHVVADLRDRFDMVLEALEADDGWVTNRVTPGKVILGNLDGVDTGIRQLVRRRPLEVVEVSIGPQRRPLRIPTQDEMLRIKAFLALRRNATRDYLDLAALSDRAGVDNAARALARIDDYYADQAGPDGERIAAQVARQLAEPRPHDLDRTDLRRYRRLESRWHDWGEVVGVCRSVARDMLAGGEEAT